MIGNMIPQVHGVDISKDFTPAKNFGTIASFVNLFIPLLMTVAAVLTLVMFLWGAYTFLSASGEPEKLDQSKKIFVFTVVGLVIIIGSFLFVKLIGKILGVPVL